jgi:hypothetical protein
VASRLFAHGIYEQPRSMIVLKRVILPLLFVHVVLVTWSGYRAIVQVFSLDLDLPGPVAAANMPVTYQATSSGRATVTLTVELIQGSLKRQIARRILETHTNPSYDPRPIRVSDTLPLTAEMLAQFAAGPATVRATAVGRSQWLRTPPPTAREQSVIIEK